MIRQRLRTQVLHVVVFVLVAFVFDTVIADFGVSNQWVVAFCGAVLTWLYFDVHEKSRL